MRKSTGQLYSNKTAVFIQVEIKLCKNRSTLQFLLTTDKHNHLIMALDELTTEKEGKTEVHQQKLPETNQKCHFR